MIAAYQTNIWKYENVTNDCTNKSMQVCELYISMFDRQRSKKNNTLERVKAITKFVWWLQLIKTK